MIKYHIWHGGINMRLRNVKDKEEILDNCNYLIKNPEDYKGKWKSLFNNDNPIYIEIGMGKGKFILEKALKYKKKGKLSYRAVLKQLNKSFITPIEREDIQTIAVQLNKITKKIVKACLNLEVYRLNNYTEEMKEQALTLVQATDKLAEIIKLFKKVSDVEKITKLNIEMKEIESHGDEIHRRAMGNLFSGKYEALEVIKLRDMYKEIENAFDACFYVSDTILNVVLKQS